MNINHTIKGKYNIRNCSLLNRERYMFSWKDDNILHTTILSIVPLLNGWLYNHMGDPGLATCFNALSTHIYLLVTRSESIYFYQFVNCWKSFILWGNTWSIYEQNIYPENVNVGYAWGSKQCTGPTWMPQHCNDIR